MEFGSLRGLPKHIPRFPGLGAAGGGVFWRKEILRRPGEFLKKGLALDDGDGDLWNGFGWSLYDGGNYGKALEAFRKAVERCPGDPYPLNGLGWTLLELGYYAEAEKIFSRAHERDSSLWDPLLGLALVLEEQRRYDAAEKAYREVLSLSPDHAEALEGLQRLSLLRKQEGKARKFFP